VKRAVLWAVFVAYCAVVAFGAVVHEPWWDEAQAWLIARDAPLADLFLHHVPYEGHPPLWYLLLMIPAKLGLPYAALKIVAALIGAIGVYVLLFRVTTLPLVLRVLAPFTFYFAFQYTVVARSYVLLGATLWALAAIYEERAKRFPLFVLLLGILAGVSVHGFALALGFAGLFVLDALRGRVVLTRRAIAPIAAFLVWATALVVMLMPPDDVASKDDLFSPASPMRYVQLFHWIVPELFGAPLFITVPALLVFIVWLARSGFVLPFLVLTAGVLGVSAIYYSQWHEGLFFFVMLFCAAIAFGRAKDVWLTRIVVAMLVLLFARHIQWTVLSVRYDATHEFTGSEEAAKYIERQRIDRQTLYAFGTRAMELQPYFEANIFDNHESSYGAMWDWSPMNQWPYPRRSRESPRIMRDWFVSNIARQPEFVVCALGFRNDHLYALAMERQPNYRTIGKFYGRTFWKTQELELISFQLFQRVK
jgi:hypothetical protein